MAKLFWFGLVATMVLVLAGCAGPKNSALENKITNNTTQPAASTETNAVQSHGSCDTIDRTSQCVDYIGSIWTTPLMQTHCGDGKLSANACPRSANGGCRVTANTSSEAIIWSYPYGGSPVIGDLLTTTKNICGMTAGSKWIDPSAGL